MTEGELLDVLLADLLDESALEKHPLNERTPRGLSRAALLSPAP
jgi:hypothetical protein